MIEIEFSVMESNVGDAQNLLPLLEVFEKQYHIHVNLVGIPWFKGWTEVAKFGSYGHGPDVSSVGTTWIGSLASMQALRPFTQQEVRAMGGADAFFEANWRAGFLPDNPSLWAIPWLGDVMVLYYWKDALEKVGIQDLEAAFANYDAWMETLKKLQKGGIPYPIFLTTARDPVNTHEAAYWIWTAGGDFVSEDQRQVVFNQPAALEGLRKYFSLKPFISPKSFETHNSEDLFINKETAVLVAGSWLGMIGRQQHPEWHEQLGIAQLPGKGFVGGSNFVIWQYSLHAQEAFELVRFLGSQPICFPASLHDHQVPVRREAVNMPVTENNVFNRTYLRALQNGKTFPTMRLWSSVEDKLITEISAIWTELFADPDQDLDECLHRHFDPLARRLDNTLGN